MTLNPFDGNSGLHGIESMPIHAESSHGPLPSSNARQNAPTRHAPIHRAGKWLILFCIHSRIFGSKKRLLIHKAMFINMLQDNLTLWHPTTTGAGGKPAFQRQAGERRRRASSLQLASPPFATRNGLACLPLKCAILTHKFCYRPIFMIFQIFQMAINLKALFHLPKCGWKQSDGPKHD